MSVQPLTFHGQPALQLTLPDGDSAVATLHGGQLLSWKAAGAEQLYLSPQARFDGHGAIRGGVPLCFPQFNQRGTLPKHGFARNLPWQAVDAGDGAIELRLATNPATQAFWPAHFAARLRVELAPGQLRVALTVRNTGSTPWPFTAALHTYLRVHDVTQARLEGLQDAPRWDAVRDARFAEPDAALRFGEEFDSVYAAPPHALHLHDGPRRLRIEQSPACPQTVVWNPGPVLCAQLADLPADGWRHMLCVEAASIDAPVLLEPGASWEGWQRLALVQNS
jgi:glucose-6-phosphate 1-epimerase